MFRGHRRVIDAVAFCVRRTLADSRPPIRHSIAFTFDGFPWWQNCRAWFRRRRCCWCRKEAEQVCGCPSHVCIDLGYRRRDGVPVWNTTLCDGLGGSTGSLRASRARDAVHDVLLSRKKKLHEMYKEIPYVTFTPAYTYADYTVG